MLTDILYSQTKLRLPLKSEKTFCSKQTIIFILCSPYWRRIQTGSISPGLSLNGFKRVRNTPVYSNCQRNARFLAKLGSCDWATLYKAPGSTVPENMNFVSLWWNAQIIVCKINSTVIYAALSVASQTNRNSAWATHVSFWACNNF